jgi:hypothetical protein
MDTTVLQKRSDNLGGLKVALSRNGDGMVERIRAMGNSDSFM